MAGLVPGAKTPDAILAGISRAPITVTLPPNLAAAFRAGAYYWEVSPYEEVFNALRSGAVLALDESERDDVPEDKEAWLLEGVELRDRPIVPSFTDSQRTRLTDAAELISRKLGQEVTLEQLVVAGAMQLLDGGCSCESDNIDSIKTLVDAYALSGVAFIEPERGTLDPLQSYA